MYDPETQHYMIEGVAFPAMFELPIDTMRHLAHPLSYVVTGTFQSVCDMNRVLELIEEWPRDPAAVKICPRCIRVAREEIVIVNHGG